MNKEHLVASVCNQYEIMLSVSGKISLFLSCLFIDSIIISLEKEKKKNRAVVKKKSWLKGLAIT
jgi:hypothetical protein